MTGPVRPRRKGSTSPNSSGNATIPTTNHQALVSCYCAIFSLIPGLGLFLGLAAVVLGYKGLDQYFENPQIHGRAHAYVGMTLGILTFLVNLAVVLMILFVGVAGGPVH